MRGTVLLWNKRTSGYCVSVHMWHFECCRLHADSVESVAGKLYSSVLLLVCFGCCFTAAGLRLLSCVSKEGGKQRYRRGSNITRSGKLSPVFCCECPWMKLLVMAERWMTNGSCSSEQNTAVIISQAQTSQCCSSPAQQMCHAWWADAHTLFSCPSCLRCRGACTRCKWCLPDGALSGSDCDNVTPPLLAQRFASMQPRCALKGANV